MNVQNRKRSRRKGQALVRTVFALGTLSAGAQAYLLSGVNRVEAIVLPGIIMGLLIFGAAVYGRARRKQQWSAAWDAYAEQAVSRPPSGVPDDQEALSWAARN